jgi:hypothetical protein
MKFFHRIGFVGTAGTLWLIAAIGFFGMRFLAALVVFALPFCIPGFLVLGVDEVQERYGYWGEPFYDWLLSLPCVLLYAWLIHRRSRRVVHHDSTA